MKARRDRLRALPPAVPDANQNRPEGRDIMSRILRPSPRLVAVAVVLLSAIASAALPLVALADNGPPLGS
jgi:hypothetical protein